VPDAAPAAQSSPAHQYQLWAIAEGDSLSSALTESLPQSGMTHPSHTFNSAPIHPFNDSPNQPIDYSPIKPFTSPCLQLPREGSVQRELDSQNTIHPVKPTRVFVTLFENVIGKV